MQRNDALALRKSESDLDCSSRSGSKKSFKVAKNPYGTMFNGLWKESRNNYQLRKAKKSYFTENSNSNGQIVQTAGMRVFATVLLNAWRKRKEDVKELTLKVSELKRAVSN